MCDNIAVLSGSGSADRLVAACVIGSSPWLGGSKSGASRSAIIVPASLQNTASLLHVPPRAVIFNAPLLSTNLQRMRDNFVRYRLAYSFPGSGMEIR